MKVVQRWENQSKLIHECFDLEDTITTQTSQKFYRNLFIFTYRDKATAGSSKSVNLHVLEKLSLVTRPHPQEGERVWHSSWFC